MKYAFLLFLLSLTTLATAQRWGRQETVRGNGDVVTTDREVGTFDGVTGCCNFRVEITRDAATSVRVEAESNLQDYILVEVSGNRLQLSRKNNVNFRTDRDVTIYVTMPELTYVNANSAADVVVGSMFTGEELEARVSSGGRLEAQYTGRVDARADSGGAMKLSGTGSTLTARADSGGSVEAQRFEAHTAEADASSGGGVEVNVSEELEADADSGGTIRYTGKATKVDARSSSGGSVRKG